MKAQRNRTGGNGGMNPPPQQMPEWQKTGYRMQDRYDERDVVDDLNDGSYIPADTVGMPPVSMDVDGMSATGVDPKLQEERSRTVREHVGQFWSNVNPKLHRDKKAENAFKSKATGETEESMPETPDELGGNAGTDKTVSGPQTPAQTHPGGRVVWYVLGFLAVVVGVGVLIATEMFRITDIRVEGNRMISAEEIIRISGVRKGDYVIALNDKQIGEAISTNRYLKLLVVEHDNHTVTLQVYEREPEAFIVVRGIYYVLDRRGMVLEEYADPTGLADHLVQVDKMNVRSCVVGKHVTLYDSAVMDAYIQLMLEFYAMGISDEIAVLYLDDLDNISLSTRSGYYVRMGDATYLHGKLRSMMLAITALRENAYVGGTIDVSVRETPTYSPEMTDAQSNVL